MSGLQHAQAPVHSVAQALALSQAQASLDALATSHPQAAALACYASLATRLDSSLLRRLRLHLLPGADASAEADLWFSDLSESRDADWMVLDPAVATLLRERLATQRLPSGARALDLAYHHTRQVHAAWPESLQLEEELVYLALRDGPLSAAQIAQRLRPVLAAIASQPQRAVEVSRWVLRALPNLPAVVRQTDEAVAMGLAAIAHLGATPAVLGGDAARALPPGLHWLLPAATLARKTRLAVALQGRALVLRSATAGTPASRCIELPLTQPLLLELRSTGSAPGAATSVRTLPLRLGEAIVLPEGWRALELRGLDGASFRIERVLPQAAVPWSAKFEVDVFVSYAHIDNQPLIGDSPGWVTQLVQALDSALAMRLGRPVRLWRDAKLAGNDIFLSEGDTRLRSAALLLCVVSPRYLHSDWCRREVEAFIAAAGEQGGLSVDNRPRVVQVLTQPVQDDQLPAVLRQTAGHAFFSRRDGDPRRLEPVLDPSEQKPFFEAVHRLARDIADTLRALDGQRATPATTDASLPVVYLAESTDDLQGPHKRLKAELQQRGYRVLPAGRLPDGDEAACRAAVAQALAQARLAVHLVGRHSGRLWDSPGPQSLLELQLDLAAEQSQRSGLRRLIWLAPGVDSGDPVQQALLDRLQQDAGWQAGADLLVGSLEALTTALLDSLPRQLPAQQAAAPALANPEAQPPTPSDAAPQATAPVYLVCTPQDRAALRPLRDWCQAQGLALLLPPTEGDAAARRDAHERALADCAAVLLYYGAGSAAWLRAVEADLRRQAHHRRGRPAPTRATCVAAPDSADKQALLDAGAPGLIDLRSGWQPQALTGWARALRGTAAPA